MKKFNTLRILGVLLLFCLCGVQASAASGYIPCVGINLTKDKSSVTSDARLLDASYMYCETTTSAKHSVVYEAKGSNNGRNWYVGQSATYAKGTSGSKSISKNYNYWKITLTGNSVKKTKEKMYCFWKSI